MNIEIIKGDITVVEVDVVVNAANTSLLGGGGVDGAIHRKGGKAILDDCMKIRQKQGGCKVGEAVITTAGKLPAKHVIHTVGPVWNNGQEGVDEKLKNCYVNSLKLAEAHGLKSIAFPNISTGIYRYPKYAAAAIALKAIKEYGTGETGIEHVVFVCFDQKNYDIYQELM